MFDSSRLRETGKTDMPPIFKDKAGKLSGIEVRETLDKMSSDMIIAQQEALVARGIAREDIDAELMIARSAKAFAAKFAL